MISIHKKILLLSVSVLMIIVCGCARAPQITRSVSAENFSKYEKIIRMISDKYDLSMSEINDPNYHDENDVNKEFSLTGTDLEIYVGLANDALDTEEKGEETFLVAYNIPENKDFDLELFCELVNSISGRTISTEYCDKFLHNLDTSQRFSNDYDEIFSDSKPLNFESNWVISYTLKKIDFPNDYSQELLFGGLTIAGFV